MYNSSLSKNEKVTTILDTCKQGTTQHQAIFAIRKEVDELLERWKQRTRVTWLKDGDQNCILLKLCGLDCMSICYASMY